MPARLVNLLKMFQLSCARESPFRKNRPGGNEADDEEEKSFLGRKLQSNENRKKDNEVYKMKWSIFGK